MGGERLVALVYSPDVDVVDESYAFHFLYLIAKFEYVYMLRRSLKQHIGYSDNQMAGVPHDEQRDDDAENRIDYVYMFSTVPLSVRMRTAEITTATEPRRSAITCCIAPSTLRLCSEER